MNWCKPHWDLLRTAIKERGLDKFGAQNSQALFTDLTDQLKGVETQFDPLMGCWARINSKMAESLERLGRADEVLQFKCPLCVLVDDGQPETVENWINGSTDGALGYAIEQGLIKEH